MLCYNYCIRIHTFFFSEQFENKLQTSSCLTQKYFSMYLLKARTFPLHNHMSQVQFPRKSFLGWRSACRRLIKEYSSGCWTCLWSVNTGQENTKWHPTRPLGCHTFVLAAHCVTLAWSPNDRSQLFLPAQWLLFLHADPWPKCSDDSGS